MGQFLNPIGSNSGTLPPGERRFGERLKTLLEEDYLCWHNVPVGPSRQYPDYVMLHPRRGLWVFEVKDWRLEAFHAITKHSVELHVPDGGIKTLANPLEQARGYCMTIVNKLSSDPQLQDPDARYRGKICFPYGYAAIFPNITRRQFDEVMSETDQEQVLPSRRVICKDEMTESTPAEVFQEKLWGMFDYAFGSPLTLPQVERVRWHMFPEIRITSVQQDFFATATGTEEVEEIMPEIVRVMDIQQEQLARSLGSGHRVIHGVAGSGKTLILGYRCLHLARTSHKPILVLCFNITLAARLRSFVAEKGIADNVQVYHFHEWCKTQLTTYHVETLAGTAPVYERQVASVIKGVSDGFIPRAQYGAVLIDEGHDFEPDWLRLVAQMTDPETDSLLLLYDDAQSIYRKSGLKKFSLSSVGIKAQGRTTILRLNYRNTREILTFAYDFASAFLCPEEADDDHIPVVRPEAAGTTGPKPAFRFHDSIEAEIDFAVTCIRKWQAAGSPLSEIALVYLNAAHGKIISERLKSANIPCLWMASPAHKSAYNPARDEVAILTAHSSKGLEFSSVIIVGVGQAKEDEQSVSDRARLLYVAMTRAKTRLLLTASTRNAVTERLQQLAA